MESDPEGPGGPLPAAPAPVDEAPIARPKTPPVFSLNRQTADVSGVISRASEAWQRDVGTWVLAFMVAILIYFALFGTIELVVGILEAQGLEGAMAALVLGLQAGSQLLGTLYQGVMIMGVVAMGVVALHGKPASLGLLFSQISKAFKYLLQMLAIYVPLFLVFAAIAAAIVALSVGSIDLDMPIEDALISAAPALGIYALVSVPVYVYIYLGLCFAPYELAYNDSAGPVEAVVYSWRIARGRRWLILWVVIIASLIAVGSLMLCGVGFLFGGPLSGLMLTTLYLALRDGADVPPADTGSTLGPAPMPAPPSPL